MFLWKTFYDPYSIYIDIHHLLLCWRNILITRLEGIAEQIAMLSVDMRSKGAIDTVPHRTTFHPTFHLEIGLVLVNLADVSYHSSETWRREMTAERTFPFRHIVFKAKQR